jgi:hypothetical protein
MNGLIRKHGNRFKSRNLRWEISKGSYLKYKLTLSCVEKFLAFFIAGQTRANIFSTHGKESLRVVP